MHSSINTPPLTGSRPVISLVVRCVVRTYTRQCAGGPTSGSHAPCAAHAPLTASLLPPCAQENVKRVQLANEYLDGAALAGVGGSSLPENVGAKVEEVCAAPHLNPALHLSDLHLSQRCWAALEECVHAQATPRVKSLICIMDQSSASNVSTMK